MTGAVASAVYAGALEPTPRQTAGPFYPRSKPLDQDADLTQVRGRAGRATGQVIHVIGRVLTPAGLPLAGATIEIWQANARGRYAHPGDRNSAPLDPAFEGFASLVTDAAGRYRFKTIKPGAYPAGDTFRAPHIHVGVHAAGHRLVTQMYFAGEAANATDSVLGALGARSERLIVTLGEPTPDLEPESRVANWDIVLGEG